MKDHTKNFIIKAAGNVTNQIQINGVANKADYNYEVKYSIIESWKHPDIKTIIIDQNNMMDL